MTPPAPVRGRGQHGRPPLGRATRRRLLTQLLQQAEAGDSIAAGVLVLLSLRAEQAKAANGSQPEVVAA